MEKRKTILDRKPLSSEYIRGRQDFDGVLKAHKAMKPPLWKSAWFYGPVGLAVIAIIVSVTKFSPSETPIYDSKTTLAQHSGFSNITAPPEKVKIPEKTHSSIKDKAEEKEVIDTAPVKEKTEVATPTTIVQKEQPVEKTTIVEVKEEVETLKKLPPPPPRPERRSPFVEKVTTIKNTMPSIAGVFTGSIKANSLCDENGIVYKPGWQIISYTINYDNGVQEVSDQIQGNRIPLMVCSKLKRFNLNRMVFITDIRAVDDNGKLHPLPNMNLTPVY